jgi:hypothetical protein
MLIISEETVCAKDIKNALYIRSSLQHFLLSRTRCPRVHMNSVYTFSQNYHRNHLTLFSIVPNLIQHMLKLCYMNLRPSHTCVCIYMYMYIWCIYIYVYVYVYMLHIYVKLEILWASGNILQNRDRDIIHCQ